MSTAVIISGQMRTFATCYPTQRWQVYRHYEEFEQEHAEATEGSEPPLSQLPPVKKSEPHFFVSCCDDADADSAELLRQHYANVHIEKWVDPTDLPDIPHELGAHAPYRNAASHRQLMLQHWGNQRAWNFFQKFLVERTATPLVDSQKAEGQASSSQLSTKDYPLSFDTVIRMRPDNLFHRFVPPKYFTGRMLEHECYTPWWGKFGGINDRLAIMGIKAAVAYFNTYDKIPELLAAGCPFHPESLVASSLLNSSFLLHTSLLAHFSTLRLNNDQRWPEITAEDLAELISNR